MSGLRTFFGSRSFFSILGLLLLALCINPAYAASEKGPRCIDGLDNDGDGLIDGDDPDCRSGGGDLEARVSDLEALVADLTDRVEILESRGRVDPDEFPAGTDLRNAFPGITLSVEGNPTALVRSLVGTLNDGPAGGSNVASTGTRVFGHDVTGSVINEDDFFRVWTTGIGANPTTILRVDFDTPTDFVSIDMIADDDDVFELSAFDSDDNLLEVVNLGSFVGVMTFTISRPSRDISYVLAGGTPGEGGPMDNLRFSP